MAAEMTNIEIRDFQTVSGVNEGDYVVLSLQGGSSGKMAVGLFRASVASGSTPSIKDGVWWIGQTDTGVQAEGKTPEMRRGEKGVEYRYMSDGDDSWKLLVPYEDIRLDFDSLTEAQRDQIRLKYSDLTQEEVAELQQPAADMIAALEKTDSSVREAEDVRKEAEEVRSEEYALLKGRMESSLEGMDAATESALDTAVHPTYVGIDNYVYQWDKEAGEYVNTRIYVKGDRGEQGPQGPQGERGEKGENGDGAGNVLVSTEGLVKGRTYLFEPGGDASAEGRMVEYAAPVIDTSQIATKAELEGKVDKVEGKQLSTEDFTSLLKQKLDGLSNYDDTGIQETVSKLRTDLDALVSGDTTTAIRTFNEVIAFLEGLEDTENLSGIIASIERQIADKAGKSDIPTRVSELENDVPYALKSDVEVEADVENGVYAVTADDRLVDYNTADSSCTGVALVVGGHQFMISKEDATDGTNASLYWGKGLYGKDIAGLVTNDKVDGTYVTGFLGGTSTPQLSTDITTWTAGALSEFDGRSNTAAVIAGYTENGADMDSRDMCKVLETYSEAGHTDWYVPALGQLALICINKEEINAALANIGGTAFAPEHYWSSSEKSSSYSWLVNFGTNGVPVDSKDSPYCVRFIRDITPVKPLKERVFELERSIPTKVSQLENDENFSKPIHYSDYNTDYIDVIDTGLVDVASDLELNTSSESVRTVTSYSVEYNKYGGIKSINENPSYVGRKKVNGATAEKAGFMTSEDKIKLDGIDMSTKQDKIAVVDHGTGDTTFELAPNVLHRWGTVTSLTLTLAAPADTNVANYYMFEFTSGDTATTLSLPESVAWAGDVSIEAGKKYQVSILDGCGVIGGF